MKSYKEYIDEYNSSTESRHMELNEWLMYKIDQKEEIIRKQKIENEKLKRTCYPFILHIERLARECISKYGEKVQEDIAIEECLEFVDAILKYRRGRCDIYHVGEEIADAIITLGQMAYLYGHDAVIDIMIKKIKRQFNRLRNNE